MSTQAPVEFEIPRPVIAEAIVNAVAHRNYRNNGFVQVIVFADRVEVWNPGELPPGLPEPDFRQSGPHFVTTLWRGWLTEEVMNRLLLKDSERDLVALLKVTGRIANKSYQEKFGVTKATASRHLEALADKGILVKIGTTGKGTYYVLSRKGLTNSPKDS